MTASGAASLEQAARLLSNGQLDAAARACRGLLAVEPRNSDALDLLGMIARFGGNHPQSLQLFGMAIAANPKNAVFHLHRGLALKATGGNREEIVRAFQSAVSLSPKMAEAHHQLGNALKAAGRYDEALASLRTASELEPTDATIWLNRGVAHLQLAQTADAVSCFQRAVGIEPSRAEAHNVLGVALLELGNTSEAIVSLRKALELQPANPAAHDNLARACRAQGQVARAIEEFRSSLSIRYDATTHSNLLFTLNFSESLTPMQVAEEHRAWGLRHDMPTAKPSESVSDPVADRKLRIGFVSPDLVSHAVAFFFEPLLTGLNRSEFEVFCYSDAPVPDRVTARLRQQSDQWRDTAVLGDEQLERTIRRDGIDVLIDLAGHTGNNRLRVFARKVAPVQVTWLGYPNTTGLKAMDYRLTDAVADPIGLTELLHTEELVRLRRSFLCYRPPLPSPQVSAPACVASGEITFGSFSNYPKISDACLDLWAEIMRRVPKSRLLLKSRGLNDAGTGSLLQQRLEKRGIAKDRVHLHARLVPVYEHLSLYHQVDIALDPFPYNGTTTTCEALWMGVPVVTLAGRSHVSRVGASLLASVGHPEWVADDAVGYVENACRLASDIPTLEAIRSGLRARLEASPLCDAEGFAAEFGSVLRSLWQRRCAGKQTETDRGEASP